MEWCGAFTGDARAQLQRWLHDFQPRAAYSVCRDICYSAASPAFFSPEATRLRISSICTAVGDVQDGAELLFETFSQRYERASTLVTSNLPFEEWTEILGSERLTGALLDRIIHHVHILEMNGDSYRLKQCRRKRTLRQAAKPTPPNALRGRRASSATFQWSLSPENPCIHPVLLVYFYSASVVCFYSSLDSHIQAFITSVIYSSLTNP